MALSRYEIRNEFSLADAELYKSADKDDPEALLEGVAMAGLVGLLRQLGDLSQFAAELFHNLHEEVMATAARGHSLKSRIQLLEVEFPLIEKAFLSQRNHSAFFYTAGVDWHPNMRIDQNYITREDLPCFMMDSYEEARGPPRLFLLDKFDVVGEGACLKRYTDPSFYKVETAALGITNADVQQDKKLRKGKRRGSRRRNAETPEVIPTPHAKLHRLLLEERIENRVNSDPARRVKLKRRLNGFPFDLKTGQSYMKKILLDPPPDYRELHEVCYPSPLRLLDNNLMPEHEKDKFGPESLDVELAHKSPSMSPDSNNGVLSDSIMEMNFDTSNESDHFKPEFEKDEIGLKSPSLQLTHGNPSMTPHMTDDVPNISTDKQEFDAFDIESKCMPKAQDGLEVGNITSMRYEDVVEKQVMVDKGRKSEGSTGYQSDDVGCEVENYMDALATMESEREIDSELRTKGNLNVLRNRKRISDPDAATPLHQARSSDSQSMGSSTLSDDGNSSSRKCKSNSSYSSSRHFLDKKAHVVDVVSDEINSFYETGEAKSISRPLKWRGRNRNAGGSKVTPIPTYSSDDIEHSFTSTDVSPGVFFHRDADELGETEVSQLKSGPLFAQGVRGAEPSNSVESESNMSPNASDSTSSETPLRTEYDSSFREVAENQSSDNGEIKHLTEHSSSAPVTSDDTCFTGRSGDQHMEEVVDKQIYLLIDPSLTSLTSDGAPLDCEENLSSSPKYQPPTELANDNLSMSEHPSKPSPKEPFETELREDLPNDESGARQVLGVLYRESLYPSSCTEDTAEEVMVQLSLPNRPQIGGRENDFEAYPVVNQSDSQMTIVPLAEEQTTEPRLPELETNDKAIDTVSTDANLVKAVSPSKEVEAEERPMSPFRRDLCSKNFRIFGITDILQPLDPAGRSIDNQIEEQFSDMSDEQFPDTSLSDTEDCSAGADFNDIILDRSTVALPAREITVDMRDQALSGIPKVGDTIDIQASVVLDSVPQSVDTSDNGDEIPHKLPALAVTVDKGVSASGKTDLGTESLKHCALNEIQASETADDMLLHKAARVEVSSDQIINLHELERLVGEELEGVASSKELGERITADGESVAEEQKVRQETNSQIIGKEGISGVDSIYFSRNLLGQQLDSELFPREKPTIDGVGQHNKPIGSISLALGLLPEAVNTDIVEMPPLPPLPPVEWRTGKNQQACLAHEQAVLQNNNILFPSSSMSVADQRAEAPELILPSYAKAAENSLLTYESTSDTLDHDSWALGESQPIDQNLPFPGSNSNLLSLGALQTMHNNLLLPENEADLAVTEFHSPIQDFLLPANNKFPSLSETQSVCQNLPLPAKLDEMHQYDDHTGTSLNAYSSLSDGDAASVCDVELLVDSETLLQFNKAKETNQNKILGQGSASSQSNASTHDASAFPPKIENEQPHNMILCLEGEVGWPAQDEFEQSRVRPMKLPRQRNPLIDAVIALDKSKLRKVTEQPRTQIQKASDRDSGLENLQLRKVTEQPRTQIQKADERDSELEYLQLKKVTEQPMTEIQKADVRDSLLAQIRARSFNLKPTVVSRPGVQGPTTNLKVAAILEKAKIIRQAFAGSDEDDDDDSWSDS